MKLHAQGKIIQGLNPTQSSFQHKIKLNFHIHTKIKYRKKQNQYLFTKSKR